ncbi:MAG: hypothetical protein MZU97_22600 [Bacillus subtilis]|nr:hypothetical protein [Bacillus subtilis]
MFERLQPDASRVLDEQPFRFIVLSHAYLFEGQIGTKKEDAAATGSPRRLLCSADPVCRPAVR